MTSVPSFHTASTQKRQSGIVLNKFQEVKTVIHDGVGG